jgi:hypothetical protein
MLVADIMTIPKWTLREGELVDSAAALMLASEQNHLLVIRDGKPVGDDCVRRCDAGTLPARDRPDGDAADHHRLPADHAPP